MSTIPETTMPASAEQTNGLATYFKVLYAPGEAFSTLARIPTWGWAALIGIVLTLIGTFFVLPATIHYSHIAQEQRLSQMPADQAAQAREVMAKIPPWTTSVAAMVGAFFVPWIFWLVASVVFLIGAALGGGEARFQGAWVSAVNLYIIACIGSIISGVIVMLRGAQSVNSSADLYAVPSLAMFVHGSPKLAMFLYIFNVINIWYYVAAVIALEKVLKMSRGAAIATVVAFALLSGGIGALFAR